jgi:hypothetical protein
MSCLVMFRMLAYIFACLSMGQGTKPSFHICSRRHIMPIPSALLACAPPHSCPWHPVTLRVREGTFEGRKLEFDLTDGEVIASTTVGGTHLPSALLRIQPFIFA